MAFVGYTPQYAASVMVLNPKQNEDLGGYGGRLAAPIWRAAMEPILSAQPAVSFPPPGIPLTDPNPPPPPRPKPRPVPTHEPPPEETPAPTPSDQPPTELPVPPLQIPGFPRTD